MLYWYTDLVPCIRQCLQFRDLGRCASATECSKGLSNCGVRTTVPELQQLGKAQPTQPLEHYWREYRSLVVSNRRLGNYGPYQNAVTINRVRVMSRVTYLASFRPLHE